VKFWLMWPGLFQYFTGSHRARIIIVEGDKLLLVRDRWALWFDDDRWSLPGGGIRSGEAPADGAVRELAEELGMVVDANDLQPISVERTGEYGLYYRGYFMLLRLDSEPQLVLDDREIVEARWFTLVELEPQYLKREAVRALELLAENS
jgi:8-oxo-dGTP pyrophosphatase MutT (NUDIX family)